MAGFSMRNCPKCGNVFTYISNPICRDCQEIEDGIFETVRSYIKEHNDKTLEEVSNATDVSVKKILKYIKEGKIELAEGTGITVPCDGCGKPITKGRYCGACADKIKNKFTSNFQKPSPALQQQRAKSVMYTQQDK